MRDNKKFLIFGLAGLSIFLVLGFFLLKNKIFFKEQKEEFQPITLPEVKLVGENFVDKEIQKNFSYDEKTETVYIKDKRLPEGTKFYMPFKGRVIFRFEDLGRGYQKGKVYTYYYGLENETKGYIIDIVGPLKPLVPYNFYIAEKGTPFAEINYKGLDENQTFPIYISISTSKENLNPKEILRLLFPDLIK